MRYFLIISLIILIGCRTTGNPDTTTITSESELLRKDAQNILQDIKEHKDDEKSKIRDFVNQTNLYTQKVDAALKAKDDVIAEKDRIIKDWKEKWEAAREETLSYKADAERMRRQDRNIMIAVVSIVVLVILGALFYLRKALGFNAF